jgi:CHASE2 domain-containing sensor protein
MKQYIITLLITLVSVSLIIYGFMAFLFASFNPAAYDLVAKVFALIVTMIATGVLTERLREL